MWAETTGPFLSVWDPDAGPPDHASPTPSIIKSPLRFVPSGPVSWLRTTRAHLASNTCKTTNLHQYKIR